MWIDGCKWLMYIVGVGCWCGLLVKVAGVGVGVGGLRSKDVDMWMLHLFVVEQ